MQSPSAIGAALALLALIAEATSPPQPTRVRVGREEGVANAIVPTSPGQIGVNPVTSDLGPVSTYELTDFAPDQAADVTYDGNTYHYIEAHTGYLTIEEVPTTINNQPTTIATTIQVIAATASAGSPDQSAGDVGLVFAQSVAQALTSNAEAALTGCGLGKRELALRGSTSTTCLINAAIEASTSGGPLDNVMDDAFWESIPARVAPNALAGLGSAIAGLKTKTQQVHALVYLSYYGVVALAIALGTLHSNDNPIAGVNIPSEGVGVITTDGGGPCQDNGTVSIHSPLCTDPTCLGKNNPAVCTTGEYEGCQCKIRGVPGPPQLANMTWLQEQQSVLSMIAATPSLGGAAAEPSCTVNSFGNNFNGQPVAEPASWCVCNVAGTTKLFPTASATANPCDLTALPSATINPQVIHGGNNASVTSCRLATNSVTGTTAATYCTCNDNSMYATTTTSSAGSILPACAPTMTPPQGQGSPTPAGTASPSATPTCNVDPPYTVDQSALIAAGQNFCSTNNGQLLRPIPSNPYAGAVTGFQSSGASSGGKLYMVAYLDQGCTTLANLNQDDCNAAFQSIYNSCDVQQTQRRGGAASVNCQWFNITALPACAGTPGEFAHPGSCNWGLLPGSYAGWPLGTIPS